MTPEDILDLPAIEARAATATPGPWEFALPEDANPTVLTGDAGYGTEIELSSRWKAWRTPPEQAVRDAAFIAAARTDVPALAGALREAVEVLRYVQWRGDTGWDCPVCRGARPDDPEAPEEWQGHKPGCRLAALLGRVRT